MKVLLKKEACGSRKQYTGPIKKAKKKKKKKKMQMRERGTQSKRSFIITEIVIYTLGGSIFCLHQWRGTVGIIRKKNVVG